MFVSVFPRPLHTHFPVTWAPVGGENRNRRTEARGRPGDRRQAPALRSESRSASEQGGCSPKAPMAPGPGRPSRPRRGREPLAGALQPHPHTHRGTGTGRVSIPAASSLPEVPPRLQPAGAAGKRGKEKPLRPERRRKERNKRPNALVSTCRRPQPLA